MRAQDDRPVQTPTVRSVSISLGRAECGHNSDACDWFFFFFSFIYLGCHWVASVCPAVMVSGRYVVYRVLTWAGLKVYSYVEALWQGRGDKSRVVSITVIPSSFPAVRLSRYR